MKYGAEQQRRAKANQIGDLGGIVIPRARGKRSFNGRGALQAFEVPPCVYQAAGALDNSNTNVGASG